MIEEVVPPVSARSLASAEVVESSTDDHGRPGLFATATDRVVGIDAASRGLLALGLPESMLEELRWVADQEGCDVAEIVVNAIDEFLADHWVRNADF